MSITVITLLLIPSAFGGPINPDAYGQISALFEGVSSGGSGSTFTAPRNAPTASTTQPTRPPMNGINVNDNSKSMDSSGSSSYVAAGAWDSYRNKPDGIDRGFDPNYQQTSGNMVATAPNCREFIFNGATTQATCANVRQSDIITGPQSTNVGYCRWDFDGRACMCPRPRVLCGDLPQCYWFRDPTLSPTALRAQPNAGECISNAERFYNLLAGLLAKRGKKDFAIRINYSAAPAKANLPSGPYGPAVIGGGNIPMPNGMPGFGVSMNPGIISGTQMGQPFGVPMFPGIPMGPTNFMG